MPLLLLLHCLGEGPAPERASRGIGKIVKTGLVVPVHFCPCYPRPPLALSSQGLTSPFQGKTRQLLHWELRRIGTEPEPNAGAQPAVSLAECWLCVSISQPACLAVKAEPMGKRWLWLGVGWQQLLLIINGTADWMLLWMRRPNNASLRQSSVWLPDGGRSPS